ncbi:MAG: hypothetical protein KIT22_04395 [Verrucomicrobiae bacterium]|nr:hypothetical protein [Verrucomicrobiae bacterium]
MHTLRVFFLYAAIIGGPLNSVGCQADIQLLSPEVLGLSLSELGKVSVSAGDVTPKNIFFEFKDGKINAVISRFGKDAAFDALERIFDSYSGGKKHVISKNGMCVWRFEQLGYSISLVAEGEDHAGPEILYKKFK